MRLALLVAMAVSFVGLNPGPAKAEGLEIAATHQWVSTIELADGTYAVTYDFTFTNLSDISLDDVTLSVIHTASSAILPESGPVTLASLWLGQTVTVSVELQVVQPINPNSPLILIVGVGQAYDSLGDLINVAFVSHEEAVQ